MGIESYYIKLTGKAIKSSADIMQVFKQKYSVSEYKILSGRLFRRHIIDDSRFIIDKKAVVTLNTSQNITEITFELCFSNYDNNLFYIFGVAQWISSLFYTIKLKVQSVEYDFRNMTYEEFKTIISESFSDKFYRFKEHYGVVNKDILPNDFYNWIRRTGINRK